MSRRRPARSQHKHLERTAEVADQVTAAEALAQSRGPCPGSCNRAHRRRAEQHADAMLVHLGRLSRQARAAGWPDGREHVLDLAMAAADVEVQVPAALPGRPVWCYRCTADVIDAVANLPRLVAWVIDLGALQPVTRLEDGRRVSVSVPARVLAVHPFGQGMVCEDLACGHRHTRPLGPAPKGRVCTTCTKGSIEPEPGRLAPSQALATGGSSSGRAPVSPAGSPAWVEVDAAIEWACFAAKDAQHVLGHGAKEFTSRAGSSAFRYRELVRASRYLEQWAKELLVQRTAVTFGKGALEVATRLRRVAGMDDLVHRLDATCPVCGRRSLERPDGAPRVRCQHCHNTWDEHHYQLLVRTQAEEQRPADSGAGDAADAAPRVRRPCQLAGCPMIGDDGHHHHREHGQPSPRPCTCSRGRRRTAEGAGHG